MMTESPSALFPASTLRLVTHFLLHPEHRLHFRALQRHTELSVHSLQREVARLESLGLIRREVEGRNVFFVPVGDHPSWDALRTLVREHAHPAEVLRDALRDIAGIEAAFVFGSFARENPRPDSDVDLFVVSDDAAQRTLGEALLEAQVLLGRAVDMKRYTPSKLARRFRDNTAFVRDVLAGPKEWLVGDARSLEAMAEV
jgi:predicted nucleotidyltransferase